MTDLCCPDDGCIAAVIKECARDVVIERHRAGSYEAGRYVHPPVQEIATCMNIQPLPGKEAEMLPEAERGRETAVGFSPTRLEVSQADARVGDVVVDGSKRFRVVKIDNWFDVAGYDRAVLVRLGQ